MGTFFVFLNMAKEKKEVQSNSPSNGLSSDVQANLSTFDASTQEALDHLFANQHQTYEEFFNSFMYLKKEDILNHSTSTSSNTPVNGRHATNGIMASYPTGSTSLIAPHQSGTVDIESDDLLPEDIGLGNMTTSIFLRKKDSTDGRIQLDNFIDDQPFDSDNSDCYQPSICEIKPRHGSDAKTMACTSIDDLTYSMTEICLPGERELGYSSSQIPVHLRYLDITTQRRNPDERIVRNEHKSLKVDGQENESSKVEAFHLDEDFDYDNIQATPKFDFLYQ